MKRFLDRYYKYIRPYRFLYGWAKDSHTRVKRSARAEEWKSKGFKGAKLDICGGRNPYKPDEFLNVDIVSFPQVDLVCDLRKTFPIDTGVIAEVISVATLEHFRKPHVHHILKEFHRILQPGGIVRVSTPDIHAIAEGVLRGDDVDELNQQLFGKFKSDDTDDFDVHRWMYTAPQMIAVLQEIGFTNVEEIPLDIGMHDPKYTYLIRGVKA